MKVLIAALFAATLAGQALPVAAQETPAISKQEAKDLKTQSKAEYEARKDLADANHELNKADCEVTADGSAERACKKEAKAVQKAQKAEAKQIHEEDKTAIKALSTP
ncbi:hypothetical protein [Azohydromonas caseinilytica]|uniref:Uncharacterized protein n=1 Tax=Azohydromonas caseinilytica TaxID=2728836 RepID=A0A848FGE4_9BURK|nr:hypothetical protein [Azohydromonas caseinilytica]NML17220.1 hypothetical protein [Azohydromonas caseinilytica]